MYLLNILCKLAQVYYTKTVISEISFVMIFRDNYICEMWGAFNYSFVIVIRNDFRIDLLKHFPPHIT